MEPYWHNVRLRQVIGRLIRLLSHVLLPMDQRCVFVYKYLSIKSPLPPSTGKKKGGPDVSTTDEETTDEYLYSIAANKEQITNMIQEIMRSSAVDCHLNAPQNKPSELGYRCFTYPVGRDTGLAYTTSLDTDTLYDPIGNVKIKKISLAKYYNMTEDAHKKAMIKYNELVSKGKKVKEPKRKVLGVRVIDRLSMKIVKIPVIINLDYTLSLKPDVVKKIKDFIGYKGPVEAQVSRVYPKGTDNI